MFPVNKHHDNNNSGDVSVSSVRVWFEKTGVVFLSCQINKSGCKTSHCNKNTLLRLLLMSCRQCSVIHLFHSEYTVCRGFNLRLPQHSIVLSCDIHLRLLLYLFHTFPGDAVSPAHLYISSFSPLSPSCSPYPLNPLPSSLLSLCFSSHLPSPIFPSIFIPTHPPPPSIPLSLSLCPLSPLSSHSLSAVR